MKINFNANSKSEDGSCLFQYLCTITGTLAILSGGMHYGWPTPSLPKLLGNGSHIFVTDAEGSWIAVMMLLGCPVGSVLGCLTVDVIGRKKVILLTSFPLISAWIMIAYARTVQVIYVARFMAGIGDGVLYTVMPMYLCEIPDPKIRGLLGSSCSVTLMVGILLINTLGIFFDIYYSALISVVFPILLLLTFSWMPESPYFLIMKNQEELARKNLRMLKGVNDVETDINRLSKAIKCNSPRSGKFLDLFKIQSNRKAIAIVVVLRTVQQLSGITAITFYAKIIFENTDFLSPDLTTIIYFLTQSIVTVISSLLLDKAGRKPLLYISIIGCTISLIAQATYYYFENQTDLVHLNFIPVICLLLFIVFYCTGLGSIPVLMLGEMFPTDIKAFALCLAEIYFGFIATAASKFFQIIKDEFELCIPFYVFAGCSLLGLIFVVYYIPETKGRTLEEIQENLKGQNTSELKKCTQQYA